MMADSRPPKLRRKTKSLLNLQSVEPIHVRMARAGLSLTIRQLAELTGLDKATIVRFEMGQSVRPETADKIRKQLEELGAEFYAESGTRRIVVTVPEEA